MQILRELLFNPSMNFSKLKPKELENNQFDFHLKELIRAKLVEKVAGNYQLTNYGKEYANRMDTDENQIKPQAKISVWVCITRIRDGEKEFLIFTRKKQPFYGKQGFIAGKLKYGEELKEGAKRELKEETNLVGDPILVHIQHFLVFDEKSGEHIEDKFMFLHKVEEPKGELIANEEGEYRWVKQSELDKFVTNPFDPIEFFKKTIDMVNNFAGTVSFDEMKVTTDDF